MAYNKKNFQKKDHYTDTAKEIADVFIKALEEETLPWRSGFDKFSYIKPFNPASGTVTVAEKMFFLTRKNLLYHLFISKPQKK